MTNTFKYSVLKYRPSYLLGEQVNIGLLFSFVEENELVFVFPSHLQRLRSVYPEVELPFIRKYLQGFRSKATRLSGEGIISELSSAVLSREFLALDSNSFFFSEVKKGQYVDKENILIHYQDEYFASYYDKEAPKRHDDHYLVKTVADYLDAFPKKKSKLFKKNVVIRNKIGTTTFDYVWQNGSTNLVKAVSFDLKKKESIKKKSVQWYGELSLLEEEADRNGYHFDLLVAPPQSRRLIQYYQEALAVLEGIQNETQIVKESEINQYLDHALETIKPLEK